MISAAFSRSLRCEHLHCYAFECSYNTNCKRVLSEIEEDWKRMSPVTIKPLHTMVWLYKWWVVSGHTMEENREMISTHRDPWWWHTETPGGVGGNRHTRPTFWMMRRSSPSLSMLDTESPRPREGCRGALGESGDCRSRVGSKPSHTITNIWSLTLLRARTASWCVAPIRLVPFTYNNQSEGWDLLCDWPLHSPG